MSRCGDSNAKAYGVSRDARTPKLKAEGSQTSLHSFASKIAPSKFQSPLYCPQLCGIVPLR